MKKLLLPLLGCICSLQVVSQDFEVDKSEVEIYISEDGYFDVVENYDLTFTAPKHGIYRYIQTSYDLQSEMGVQEKRKIKIRNIEVPDHKFEAPMDFVQRLSDNLEIKIGDKDVTVMGPQHYQIKYRVYNAFLFEGSQIRFYWNIKPDGWYTTFHQLDFTIHLPGNVTANPDAVFVYSGPTGTTSASRDFEITAVDNTYRAKSLGNFRSGTGESVTVLADLPVGSVKEIKPWWPFWAQYGWTLIIASFLLAFYWVWYRFGKDDSVVATTSYFPPAGVDPAMAGFLINDKEDTSDLISLIPHWGARGIIKMELIPKKGWFGKEDTLLTRLQSLPAGTPAYEEKIFNGLFGSSSGTEEKEVLISSLKNSFYTTMASAGRLLKKKAQIYYDPRARKMQIITVIGILILAAILTFTFLTVWGILAAVGIVVTAIFLLFMSVHMVKKNVRGNEVFSELKGFRQFIRVAEENKLKMLLKESPSYFESTMGYALAFGLFERWAGKFEALNVTPPGWYTSSSGTYTMHNFSRSFSNTMTSAKSTMVSSPSGSSSGGGSSGGGFGGGGGGSW